MAVLISGPSAASWPSSTPDGSSFKMTAPLHAGLHPGYPGMSPPSHAVQETGRPMLLYLHQIVLQKNPRKGGRWRLPMNWVGGGGRTEPECYKILVPKATSLATQLGFNPDLME
uniref:Uncharacterized protein n=1 Tax=Corethron hystrix TaxID=216773 RepID=A0A7S1BJA2_9STRA